MTGCMCLLAQLDGLNPLNPTAPVGKNTGLIALNIMVIVGTGLALGLLLLVGARYYVRNKRHHRRHHHHHSRRDPPDRDGDQADADTADAAQETAEANSGGQEHRHHRHRRRRRRRRDHRPRNPTLGETGGLPPAKPEPRPNPPL